MQIRRFQLRRRLILAILITGIVLFVHGLLQQGTGERDFDAANEMAKEGGRNGRPLKNRAVERNRNETKRNRPPNNPFNMHSNENMSYYPFSDKGKPSNKIPVILYWSTFFGGYNFGYLKGTAYSETHCVFKCEVTSDRNRLAESSALLIHVGEWSYPKIPTSRKPWQRTIFYFHEAPTLGHNRSHFPAEMDFQSFNLTMTYRMDADIFMPYGYFIKFNKPQTGPVINFASGKTDLILWTVSNCITPSKRMEYVRHLQKHVNVTIYGFCGKGRCDKGFGPNSCHAISKRYKFYLSFENTIAQDYITEKIFIRMQSGLVPVVLGGANYSSILPPHSYIDIADFKSPKELASYLKMLDSDDKLYNAYFEWKNNYMLSMSRAPAFCKLCSLLHSDNEPHQSYKDIFSWWKDGKTVTPEVMYPHLAEFFK